VWTNKGKKRRKRRSNRKRGILRRGQRDMGDHCKNSVSVDQGEPPDHWLESEKNDLVRQGTQGSFVSTRKTGRGKGNRVGENKTNQSPWMAEGRSRKGVWSRQQPHWEEGEKKGKKGNRLKGTRQSFFLKKKKNPFHYMQTTAFQRGGVTTVTFKRKKGRERKIPKRKSGIL